MIISYALTKILQSLHAQVTHLTCWGKLDLYATVTLGFMSSNLSLSLATLSPFLSNFPKIKQRNDKCSNNSQSMMDMYQKFHVPEVSATESSMNKFLGHAEIKLSKSLQI